ncbi:MAG: porin family protein [Alphaproteobacteria bacterium]|nr:porin family protein [Alphaproteobacteria bacterium]
MIKRSNFAVALLATTSICAAMPAYAGCDGFYLAGRGGVANYEVDDNRSNVRDDATDYVIDKDRFMASGALGYRYSHFRAEIEYVWRRKNKETIIGLNKAEFKSHSYMFVVYYDFFPNYWFTPFIDAGVGYTRNKLRFRNITADTKYSIKDNSFTWSLGAGLSAKLTNHWNLDVGYRYYDMGDLSMHNGRTDITDHEVYMGVRYVF